MTLKDDITREQALSKLRETNRRLLRQLADAKTKRQEMIDAVYRAAREAALGLEIAPVTPPKSDRRKRDGETAVCVLSDWQLAKVTPSYNSDVCEQRIKRYAEKVVEITNIQRADHPVRECRVYLLGDLVEGELVFAGQAYQIDASLFEQVLVSGRRILAELVRTLLGTFERVRVVGVSGNHGFLGGRARKEYRGESNADMMLYETTRLILKGETDQLAPTLEWATNILRGQRKWYAIDRIGEHNYFLWHGDQIRYGGFAGFPWYGFGRRLSGWRHSLGESFTYSLAGHFHTPVRMYLNGLTHWSNGSTESDNLYALEELSASGEPCQWLLFASAKRVTAEYLVQLG